MPSDDECIVIAMLHGAYFWPGFDGDWYAIDKGYTEHSESHAGRKIYSKGHGRAEAARKYCIRHKLLPEVTDAAD